MSTDRFGVFERNAAEKCLSRHATRLAEGATAGDEALAQIRAFVAARNAAGLASLDEAGDQLITLLRLNVPATLHVSLLSTNAIENVMRNYRDQTAKVTFLVRQCAEGRAVS